MGVWVDGSACVCMGAWMITNNKILPDGQLVGGLDVSGKADLLKR